MIGLINYSSEPHSVELRDIPTPDIGEDDVLLAVEAVGVCGSDLHWFQDGRVGEFPANYPQVLGHEPAGEVVGVGKGVELGCRPAGRFDHVGELAVQVRLGLPSGHDAV